MEVVLLGSIANLPLEVSQGTKLHMLAPSRVRLCSLQKQGHQANSKVNNKQVVETLRLPQVFYNQGLSSLCRCVSYVRAEH